MGHFLFFHKIVIIPLVLILVCVGILAHLAQENSVPDINTEIEGLTNEAYRSYFNGHIDTFFKKEGINGMVRRVTTALQNGQITMFECHSLAHDIGHYAGYPDNFAAIENSLSKENLDFCGSGFLHGVEGQLANEAYPHNAEKLLAFCELVRPLKPYYEGCYHGAGHAFMENTRDIYTALEACDTLYTTEVVPNVTHCYRGVFSENSDYVYESGTDVQELLELCKRVRMELQVYCAQELNGLHLSHTATEDEIEQRLRLCMSVDNAIIQEGCIRSVATVAADHILSSQRKITPVPYTHTLPDDMRMAYIDATFGSFTKAAAYTADLSFDDFCAGLMPSDIEYCYSRFNNSKNDPL